MWLAALKPYRLVHGPYKDGRSLLMYQRNG